MKKFILSTACPVLITCLLNAQSISPEVIASAGEYYSNVNGSISWTLGEPMGETYSQTNNIITQGFQQPTDFGTRVIVGDPVNAEVYPNPTADIVNLQFGDNTNGQYVIEVFNTLGQQLKTSTFNATPSSKATVSLFDYSDGIYFITVRKTDGTESSTFRITKNS